MNSNRKKNFEWNTWIRGGNSSSSPLEDDFKARGIKPKRQDDNYLEIVENRDGFQCALEMNGLVCECFLESIEESKIILEICECSEAYQSIGQGQNEFHLQIKLSRLEKTIQFCFTGRPRLDKSNEAQLENGERLAIDFVVDRSQWRLLRTLEDELLSFQLEIQNRLETYRGVAGV